MAKAKAAPVVELDDAGEPEMDVLEVEKMLAQRDREEAAKHQPMPLSPLAEDARESDLMSVRDEHIASFCAAELPHELDLAPVHSKIVVISEENVPLAILAKPSGVETLDKADVAHRLPVGARIFKAKDDRYECTQLGATVDRPMLVTANAVEAIGKFIAHFHADDDE